MPKVGVKLLKDFAKLPEFKSKGAACADGYAVEDVIIPPGAIAMVGLGIALEIPTGYEVQVRQRSGLASKGIIVANSPGTVDEDYTGEIKVILFNSTKDCVGIRIGDRVCQLAVRQVEQTYFVPVNSIRDTERGSNGFGSTGR